jgi:hypothetical protein
MMRDTCETPNKEGEFGDPPFSLTLDTAISHIPKRYFQTRAVLKGTPGLQTLKLVNSESQCLTSWEWKE